MGLPLVLPPSMCLLILSFDVAFNFEFRCGLSFLQSFCLTHFDFLWTVARLVAYWFATSLATVNLTINF